MLVYDVAFQCLFIPLLVWNQLQATATNMGLCSEPRGPYYELLFVPFFFVTIVITDTLFFIAFGWVQSLSV